MGGNTSGVVVEAIGVVLGPAGGAMGWVSELKHYLLELKKIFRECCT
jgi:hypothetical protein